MSRRYEMGEKGKAFLRDLFDLYDKHGIAISHEDGHGAFILERYDADSSWGKTMVDWMGQAFDETEPEPEPEPEPEEKKLKPKRLGDIIGEW